MKQSYKIGPLNTLISKLRKTLLGKTRSEKRLLILSLDIILISIVLLASLSIKSDGYIFSNANALFSFLSAILIAIPIFIKLGLYRSILRYLPSKAVIIIFIATLTSTLAWVGINQLLLKNSIQPIIALVYWLGTFTILTGVRLTAQLWLYGDINEASTGKKVLIYGAGVAGTQLANVLRADPSYNLVGFVDDDRSLKGWSILGHTIYSPHQVGEIVTNRSITEIILAIPSASTTRRKEILSTLEPIQVIVRSIPAFADLASGKLKASDIKDIDIDDLLGRDTVLPNDSLLPLNIKEKVVMVTGAGGSIGSELCRQIINLSPEKLILLEQSEFALYQIEQELESIITKQCLDVKLNKVLGSVTNPVLLKRLFRHKNIQTIYHAAAYKHVPLVEENPVAGLSNNVFGTQLLAKQALQSNVDTFILISTDKAVRPTNVMGCSKRVSEMVLQALSDKPKCNTTFSMVRFGNVLGSSGSVVPKFRQQLKDGGPITVTHKDITRFFMSIPEAVQLVIQAGAMAEGGDVFVLDMGKSVKIADLAKKMIKLSGLTIKNETYPNGEIEIKYTGLRPGEKLYEELLIGNNVSGTHHPRIMKANETFKHWQELQKKLESLQLAMESEKVEKIKRELANLVDGYTPWMKPEESSKKRNNVVHIIK